MGVRAMARRLFGGERKLAENVVASHTKIDEAVLRDWRKRAPVLEQQFANPPEVERPSHRTFDPDGNEVPTTSRGPLAGHVWERMCEDVFYAYFGQKEPEIAARDAVAPEFRVNREVADKQVRDPRFAGQRPKTRAKGMQSSLGAVAAIEEIRKSYADELGEQASRQAELADAEHELDDLDRQMVALREQRAQALEDDDGADVDDIDEQVRQAAKRKRDVADRAASLAADQAAHQVEIVEAAKRIAARAQAAGARAVEQASLMVGVGPGSEPGREARISPEAMFALAERYAASPVLRAVAEMMGRLELTMGSERRTMRKGGSEEMVDIELGRDLAVVLPQEKMLMRHPMGRLDFFRRFTEQSLMQYEMWSEQELKRGPVIVLADGSLSMMAQGGAKNVWCRATTLAVVGIANREKRNAAAIEFGSEGQVRTFTWPKGQPLDPLECADFAEHAFAGGTSTLTGMRTALELIQHEAPFHAADLIIATDGEDTVTEEDVAIRDELRAMGVRIHGIAIGVAPTRYLLDICDRTTPVWEYDGHGEANHRLAADLT